MKMRDFIDINNIFKRSNKMEESKDVKLDLDVPEEKEEPKKKKAAKKDEKPEDKFREGYDVRWMKEIGPEHPDYYKVFPEERN
jgi:hypothetical protein